ncbi:hypothetical protein Avbf_01069 [Armadillidium vulgare]|nr:hypothetical protein Avbf_01069 [Armadillidium vulgare]
MNPILIIVEDLVVVLDIKLSYSDILFLMYSFISASSNVKNNNIAKLIFKRIWKDINTRNVLVA